MRVLRILTTMVLGVAVVAGAGYFMFYYQPQSKPAGNPFRFKRGGAVPVLSASVKTADVPVYLDGVGTVKALNTVLVRPQVDGKLTGINFTEGQDVKKGDVIAVVDPTTYQAQFDQAVAKKAQDQALLANAKLDLERYTRLAASNAGPKQQADTQRATVAQLTAQVELDQAAIDNARAVLGYTKITAPISGRTGIRQVDEGNIVHASDTTGIVTITQIKPIAVFFSLPQQRLADINAAFAEGEPLVQVVGPDNKTVVDQGKLTVIDNQVDQTTGTVKLKAEFPNPDLKLWPGQFVNVRLLINTLHDAVVVPTAAVQRGPNGTFVYVIKPDHAVSVQLVAVVQQDEAQSVIAKGLQPGQQVVTTGFSQLAEGKQVQVSNGSSQPAAAPGRSRGRSNGARGHRRRSASASQDDVAGQRASATTGAEDAAAQAPSKGAKQTP